MDEIKKTKKNEQENREMKRRKSDAKNKQESKT